MPEPRPQPSPPAAPACECSRAAQRAAQCLATAPRDRQAAPPLEAGVDLGAATVHTSAQETPHELCRWTKLNPTYKLIGLPPAPDFHGGDDNFTSVRCMPAPKAVMQTLSTLIFDGAFDRFPKLKWRAIELGAAWVPGWLRALDSAAHAFMRNET